MRDRGCNDAICCPTYGGSNCFEYLGDLLSPYIEESALKLSQKSLAMAIEGVTSDERRQEI